MVGAELFYFSINHYLYATFPVDADLVVATHRHAGHGTQDVEHIFPAGSGAVLHVENQLVSLPFNRPELQSVDSATSIVDDPRFWRALQIAASVLVIIVLIVTVVRPMLKRLLYPDARPEGDLDLDNSIVLGGDDELSLLAAQAESEPVFGVRDGHLKLPDLHRDEDLLKAVRALVANEPDLAAQVIKEWVSNKDA